MNKGTLVAANCKIWKCLIYTQLKNTWPFLGGAAFVLNIAENPFNSKQPVRRADMWDYLDKLIKVSLLAMAIFGLIFLIYGLYFPPIEG